MPTNTKVEIDYTDESRSDRSISSHGEHPEHASQSVAKVYVDMMMHDIEEELKYIPESEFVVRDNDQS